MSAPESGGYLARPTPSGLADVVEVILDKGLVIDAYVRVSLVGIELLTIDARIVIASVDTYPGSRRPPTGSTWSSTAAASPSTSSSVRCRRAAPPRRSAERSRAPRRRCPRAAPTTTRAAGRPGSRRRVAGLRSSDDDPSRGCRGHRPWLLRLRSHRLRDGTGPGRPDGGGGHPRPGRPPGPGRGGRRRDRPGPDDRPTRGPDRLQHGPGPAGGGGRGRSGAVRLGDGGRAERRRGAARPQRAVLRPAPRRAGRPRAVQPARRVPRARGAGRGRGRRSRDPPA